MYYFNQSKKKSLKTKFRYHSNHHQKTIFHVYGEEAEVEKVPLRRNYIFSQKYWRKYFIPDSCFLTYTPSQCNNLYNNLFKILYREIDFSPLAMLSFLSMSYGDWKAKHIKLSNNWEQCGFFRLIYHVTSITVTGLSEIITCIINHYRDL